MIVGKDTVVLETYDDNRLDRLIDRFTAAAGAKIPPAHPRTKVIDRESRHRLAMTWQWSLPQGVSGGGRRPAQPRAAGLHPRRGLARDAQPGPPAAGPRSRRPRPATPRRASRRDPAAGDIRRGCRRTSSTGTRSARGWASRPSRPSTAEGLDLDRLHLSRWSMIPFAELDDDRLVVLYHRARQWGLLGVS